MFGAVAVAQQATAQSVPGALPKSFTQQDVIELAKKLAKLPYRPLEQSTQSDKLPTNYDDYRKLRFRRDRALWRAVPPAIELHPLPAGWLFKQPIALSVINSGTVAPVNFQLDDFEDSRTNTPLAGVPDADQIAMPLSGFRINGALNAPDQSDEIIVFQGASYFRALGERHRYGLSARGLAIGTASAKGEEFPQFRDFWIERPAKGAREVTIHALLDSQSVAGAYKFVVRPGAETIVDITATLFPRTDIQEIGLGPLTSMNLLAPVDPTRVSDFRPRVHDSDGLAIVNGRGERIWRPLRNPYLLQISNFIDDEPKGFGLMQRHRDFSDYQDLEARYDLRPSAWIEPGRNFGKGSVMLVEIPTEQEIHDNIVAFWRPSDPLLAGSEHVFTYRIRWRDDAPSRRNGPWVAQTRSGMAFGKPQSLQFVVDYTDQKPFTGGELPKAQITTTSGQVTNTTVQLNPETSGVRVGFMFTPGALPAADLRLSLTGWDDRTPETWIYRWSAKKR